MCYLYVYIINIESIIKLFSLLILSVLYFVLAIERGSYNHSPFIHYQIALHELHTAKMILMKQLGYRRLGVKMVFSTTGLIKETLEFFASHLSNMEISQH